MAGIEAGKPQLEAFHELSNPDMDAGVFKAYIAGPEGFKIQTRNSLFRHSPLQELTSQQLIDINKNRRSISLGLSEEDKDLLADRMIDPEDGEMKFTGALQVKQLLDSYRKETDPTKKEELKKQYLTARDKYIGVNLKDGERPGHTAKVALRHIKRAKGPNGEDLISFDVKPVTFPVFKNFSKPGVSREMLNYAEAAATSMIVVTSDNKIPITHRAITNEVYPDMVGATIAGTFDGKFDHEAKVKGRLKPITEDDVLANIINEAREEYGINKDQFSKVKLVGLAEEITPLPHHEFLYIGYTKLSSNEIRTNSLQTERARKKELKPQDIESKYDFIDATPEAIFTLLTKLQAPISNTHVANYALLGYHLVLERDGKEAAENYKKQLEAGIKNNIKAIDEAVSAYIKNNPEKVKNMPIRFVNKVVKAVENFKKLNPNATDEEVAIYRQKRIALLPKLNPNGYTYELTPEEQGLEGYDAKMRASGLIKK